VIRIEIDEPTLARTRLAVSPLAELVVGLALLQRNPGVVPWPYEAWAQRARALTTPATTTGLATALGLAPSTVSEHLSALQAAGVVHRRRAGRRVLYGLEPAGTALVTLLDSGATEFVS
jgi:DNA-binding transcriptional ArsR family regulator